MLCACVMPPHLYSFILQILYSTCLPSQGPQRWLTNLNSLFCLIKLSEAESLFNLLMCEHQRAWRVVTLQRTMFRECEKIRTANLLDVLELFIKQSWQRMYIFLLKSESLPVPLYKTSIISVHLAILDFWVKYHQLLPHQDVLMG